MHAAFEYHFHLAGGKPRVIAPDLDDFGRRNRVGQAHQFAGRAGLGTNCAAWTQIVGQPARLRTAQILERRRVVDAQARENRSQGIAALDAFFAEYPAVLVSQGDDLGPGQRECLRDRLGRDGVRADCTQGGKCSTGSGQGQGACAQLTFSFQAQAG